jgi:hypothetical protein
MHVGEFKALTEQKSRGLDLAALFFPGCQYLLRRTISVVPTDFLLSHFRSVGAEPA